MRDNSAHKRDSRNSDCKRERDCGRGVRRNYERKNGGVGHCVHLRKVQRDAHADGNRHMAVFADYERYAAARRVKEQRRFYKRRNAPQHGRKQVDTPVHVAYRVLQYARQIGARVGEHGHVTERRAHDYRKEHRRRRAYYARGRGKRGGMLFSARPAYKQQQRREIAQPRRMPRRVRRKAFGRAHGGQNVGEVEPRHYHNGGEQRETQYYYGRKQLVESAQSAQSVARRRRQKYEQHDYHQRRVEISEHVVGIERERLGRRYVQLEKQEQRDERDEYLRAHFAERALQQLEKINVGRQLNRSDKQAERD